MFENLKPQPKDMILSAMMAYRADTRPQKVDLSVGVYKDVSGNTPIIQAVKKAGDLKKPSCLRACLPD